MTAIKMGQTSKYQTSNDKAKAETNIGNSFIGNYKFRYNIIQKVAIILSVQAFHRVLSGCMTITSDLAQMITLQQIIIFYPNVRMLKHQIASYSNKKSEKQFLFKIILNWKAKVVLKPIILSQRSEVILGNTHLAIDPDCCIQDSTPMFVGNWGSV